MIPDLVLIPGAAYAVLPPGTYPATLPEIGERFATNMQRQWLFSGIVEVASRLGAAGCSTMYLDGSFVSDKDEPEDFDGYWDPRGVNPELLDAVFFDFDNECYNQKRRFGGEMYIASSELDSPRSVVRRFRTDRDTGVEKGILKVKLRRNQ